MCDANKIFDHMLWLSSWLFFFCTTDVPGNDPVEYSGDIILSTVMKDSIDRQ